jgi:hypothetical protein
MRNRIAAALLCAPFVFVPAAWAQQQPAPGAIHMRPDEAFWNAIRDSGSAQSFELFLSTYPDSPYAGEARRKIEALIAEPAPAAAEGPASQAPAAAPAPAQSAAAPAPNLPAGVSAVEQARVMAASFMSVLGLYAENSPNGVVVTGLPAASPFAGEIAVGDRLLSVTNRPFTDVAGLVKEVHYLSYDGRPITFRFEHDGRENSVTKGSELTDSLGIALSHITKGKDGVEAFVWDSRSSTIAPLYAANFALRYPDDPFAATARKYVLVFGALKSLANKQDIAEIQRHFHSLGYLQSPWNATAAQMVAALEKFQQSLGDEPTGILTERQIAALGGDVPTFVTMDTIIELLAPVVADTSMAPAMNHRAYAAYEQVLGQSGVPDLTELYSSLQKHYGLPAGERPDLALLKRILAEPVSLGAGDDDHYEHFGDWRFVEHEGACIVATSVLHTGNVRGLFLADGVPRVVIMYMIKPGNRGLLVGLGDGTMFDVDEQVSIATGGKRIALEYNERFDHYGEKPASDGTISGEPLRMFKRSSDHVSMTGTSVFGGPVEYRFSARGFSKAFDTLNRQCAKGLLSHWVR